MAKLTHKHKCDGCGYIWEHVQLRDVSDEAYDANHDCAKCGRNQRTVYMPTAEDRVNRTRETIEEDPELAILLLITALAAGGRRGKEIVDRFKEAMNG